MEAASEYKGQKAALFSLVIPVYRNEGSIPFLLEAVGEINRAMAGAFEAVFVVDGSPDRCLELLREALPRCEFHSQLLVLSRNFGSFQAITAGLAGARGAYLAVMAADLQEPPELAIEFRRMLASGEYDVIVGTRARRQDPPVQRWLSAIFWGAYRRIVQREVPAGGVDVFACTRAFAEQLLLLKERNTTLVGLIFWLGYRRGEVRYERRAREHGKSAWSLRRRLRYLLDSTFAFSDLPVRLMSLIGVCGISLSLVLGAVVLTARLAGRIEVPGYTATALMIMFFGGLNSLGIGLLGEYLWRTFENTKGRPSYLVAERFEFGPAEERKATPPPKMRDKMAPCPTSKQGGTRWHLVPRMSKAMESRYFKHPTAIVESNQIGAGTRVWAFAHVLPGAVIGADCNICDHVFIENDVRLGDRVTIKSGVQLWDGVTLENEVFVGANATFTNDNFPRSKRRPETFLRTVVREGASIGANATILANLTIGRKAMVGAGAVVTHDVPPYAIVAGNPARITSYVDLPRSKTPPATGVHTAGAVEAAEAAPQSSPIRGVTAYRLPIITDLRGNLSVGEIGKGLPFAPHRYFVVFDVPSREVRGEHAHRALHQFFVCLKGDCSLVVDNGEQRAEFLLDSPSVGIHVEPMIWGTQYNFSGDALLLVLASDKYDPDDYIRDYDEFLRALDQQKNQ